MEEPQEYVTVFFQEVVLSNKGGGWRQELRLYTNKTKFQIEGTWGPDEQEAAHQLPAVFEPLGWDVALIMILGATKEHMPWQRSEEFYPKNHKLKGKVRKIIITFNHNQRKFWRDLCTHINKWAEKPQKPVAV